jgi:hypothetical protein
LKYKINDLKYLMILLTGICMGCNNAGEQAEGTTTPATDSAYVPLSADPNASNENKKYETPPRDTIPPR